MFVSLISLAGQLALIRLALGPLVTVAGAISHGFGRVLRYVLSLILLMLASIAITIPFALVAVAMGVSIEPGAEAPVTLAALMFNARGAMTLAALIDSLVQAIATGIFSVLFTLMLARIYVDLSGRTTIEADALN